MDTLQDAYRDDEEEDPVNTPSIQITPNQINPISQLSSTEINPIEEYNTTQINNDTVLLNPNPNPPYSPKISTPEPEFKVDTMEVESSDNPTQLTNKSETIGSEDVSSDSVSEEDQNPQNSDTKDLLEEEVEDEEENPSEKKQKSISNFEIDQLNPQSTDNMTPFNGNGSGNGIGSSKKSYKKKAKGNNVWTKSTSRKGKKKSKNNNNNNNGNHNAVTPKSEDAVLITPVPRFPDKNDDSPELQICLSKVYKAEKVELTEDRLSAGSCKGYRMVRATRGVSEGAWYYEIKLVSLGETGHTRLGWSTEKGDLQAPVGYDGNSFGYRDIDGSKIHKALRENYGEEGYKEGDVIGFYINLPDGNSYCPQSPRLVWYKGQKYVCAPDPKEDPPKIVPGSEISFFKNGICQGVAYKDLYGGRYFPAASMYTLPNQPNCVVKFNFGPDFECSPTDFEGRPIPNPMIDVPYHGFDNRVENGELDENKE